METTNEFYIKGMVCDRCITVIREGLTALGYPIEKVSLGKVTLNKAIDKVSLQRIEDFLSENGFELMSDKNTRLINNIKSIIEDVFSENTKYDTRLKFSSLLSESLHMNYDSISEAFSRAEGITLEHYIINKRLEKVKELLVYTDFTLTEIAYITGFSSVNHLSRQFKELTGLSPSYFKKLRSEKKQIARFG
jgi:AraC-like DNA-binding protein